MISVYYQPYHKSITRQHANEASQLNLKRNFLELLDLFFHIPVVFGRRVKGADESPVFTDRFRTPFSHIKIIINHINLPYIAANRIKSQCYIDTIDVEGCILENF